jgi:STIP1 family protein 1
MKDPVMLISGHTYEKAPIVSHLQNHNSDPLTGQQLGTKHFVENVGIRKACEDFLQANPWAHEYMPGVDFRKIKM